MNSDVFEGKWRQLRGRIKQAWGDLTDDELDRVKGNYDEFVGLLAPNGVTQSLTTRPSKQGA